MRIKPPQQNASAAVLRFEFADSLPINERLPFDVGGFIRPKTTYGSWNLLLSQQNRGTSHSASLIHVNCAI